MYEERISGERRNDCYYAHLSIYVFASQFCKNKVVLDAGCGSGYGTTYLAEHGAEMIYGVDTDREAICEARKQSTANNIEFACGDLRSMPQFQEGQFDVIFASNSLEHIDGIDSFLCRLVVLLKAGGLLLVAVPAACSQQAVAEELGNPYHLNIWSPRQWFTVLSSYFTDIRCYTHILDKQDGRLHVGNEPLQTSINETDFTITEEGLNALYEGRTHTAIFTSRNKLEKGLLPPSGQKIKMIDHSVTRPARSSWLHPFIWVFFRTSYILRYQGITALIRSMVKKAKQALRTKAG
jgi:SAM-dependent methyltransferase